MEDDSTTSVVVERCPIGRYSRTAQVLGRGAFKTVYKGFDGEEGIEVAWNQVRVNELVATKEERDRLFAEIRVLKQLKHKNIMTFFDSWLDNKSHSVNFITELFTSGTLRQYRKKHRHIDPEVLKRWAWQILCGLVYLHGHTPPIVHRDLKCDNIFINGSEGVVKIGDLGLATMLRARTAPQSVLGTPEFMAPELYDEEYDDRVDVYSFGMCLLELATLEYPYSECRNAAQIYRKVSLGVRPAALAKVPTEELSDFIRVCIAARESRPRARSLLKHPYFDSIRSEKCAVKLSAEALLGSGASTADLNGMLLADMLPASSSSSTASRTNSEANEAAGACNGLVTTPSGKIVEGGWPRPESPPGDPVFHSMGERLRRHSEETMMSPRSSTPGHAEEGGERFHSAHHLPSMESKCSEDGTCMLTPEDGLLTGDRGFCVKGKLQETAEKLNLRLRIAQPDGPGKTVEFDFDLAADTAMSVASEMVEDLSLSHEDAMLIAKAIRDEIQALTMPDSAGQLHGSFSGGTPSRQASPLPFPQQGREAGAGQQERNMPLAGRAPSGERSHHTVYVSGANSVSELEGSVMSVEEYGPMSPGEGRAISDQSMLSRAGSHEAHQHAGELNTSRKRSSSGRLEPPHEEDRSLPMKKLFDHLQEALSSSGRSASAAAADATFTSTKGARSPPLILPQGSAGGTAGSALAGLYGRPPTSPLKGSVGIVAGLAGLGAASVVREAAVGEELSLRDGIKSAPASATGSREASPTRLPASQQHFAVPGEELALLRASTASVPPVKFGGVASLLKGASGLLPSGRKLGVGEIEGRPLGGTPLGGLGRTRPESLLSAASEEEREARRKLAANYLRDMEENSLKALDGFGFGPRQNSSGHLKGGVTRGGVSQNGGLKSRQPAH